MSEHVRLLLEDQRKQEERARRDSKNAKQVEEQLEIMKNSVERLVKRSVTSDGNQEEDSADETGRERRHRGISDDP